MFLVRTQTFPPINSMEGMENPLLLRLKQLFFHYLHGISVHVQSKHVAEQFPMLTEEDVKTLNMVIADKMKAYILTSGAKMEDYLQQEGVAVALDRYYEWVLRCNAATEFLREHPERRQDLEVIRELVFGVPPSLPGLKLEVENYVQQAQAELEALNQENEALEALRQDINEEISERMSDLFPS